MPSHVEPLLLDIFESCCNRYSNHFILFYLRFTSQWAVLSCFRFQICARSSDSAMSFRNLPLKDHWRIDLHWRWWNVLKCVECIAAANVIPRFAFLVKSGEMVWRIMTKMKWWYCFGSKRTWMSGVMWHHRAWIGWIGMGYSGYSIIPSDHPVSWCIIGNQWIIIW